MVRFPILVVTAALATGACSSKDATQDASTSASTAAEISATSTSSAEPTETEISNYTLDMDKMTKWGNAIKYLTEAAEKNPTLVAALKTENNESTSESIRKLEGNATARAALSRAGLSSRDYVWITTAWLQAAMTEGIMSTTPGAKMPEGQNPKNVEFIRTHRAEIQRIAKAAGMSE